MLSSLAGDLKFWMGPLAIILGAIWAFRFGSRLGSLPVPFRGSRLATQQSLWKQLEAEKFDKQAQQSLVPLSELNAEAAQTLSPLKDLSAEEKLEQAKERIRATLPAPPQVVTASARAEKTEAAKTESAIKEESPVARELQTQEEKPESMGQTVAKIRGGMPRPPVSIESVKAKKEDVALRGLESFKEYTGSSRSRDELISRSCRFLADYSETGRVVFLDFNSEESSLKVSARSETRVFAGTQPKMFIKAIKDLEQLDSSTLLQRTLQDACLLETNNGEQNEEASRNFLLGTRANWTTIPVFENQRVSGYFAIQTGKDWQNLGAAFKNVFSALVSWRTEYLEQKQQSQQATGRDVDTGIWTEGELVSRLEEAMMTAQRLKHPLTLVRLDLEHWDLYIRKYGSEAGAALLRHTVRNIQRVFRRTDFVGRVGRSGICLLMPHTALVDALKKLENFTEIFAKSELRIKNSEGEALALRPFLNVGVAEYPSHCASAEKLLSLSHKAIQSLKGRTASATQDSRLALARAEQGYVAPFNSRFVRSAPRPLLDA